MNKLTNEIREKFALKSGDGAYAISMLEDTPYKAWVIKVDGKYGTAIQYDGEEISEYFSNAFLETKQAVIEDSQMNVLWLYSMNDFSRNALASICTDFISPGKNGEQREKITKAPYEWWNKWKTLLGNRTGEKKVYDILGEMMSVIKLYEEGENPIWAATGWNTHDIETDKSDYEIKSTLRKESSQIHISSQFQLDTIKPLYIIFNRFEQSSTGISIDGAIEELKKYDKDHIYLFNEYLGSKGFAIGNHGRKEKYKILERRKYLITNDFPKIIPTVFKNEIIPLGISHIEYDVNLDGILFENWT